MAARRRWAALSGGLTLVLVICAVASGGGRGVRSVLSSFAVDGKAVQGDVDAAKTEHMLDRLTRSLDGIQKHAAAASARAAHQREVAAEVKAVEAKAAEVKAAEAKAREAKARAIARKFLRRPTEAPALTGNFYAWEGSAAPHLASLKQKTPLMTLQIVDSLTAALKVLSSSQVTPVGTRKLATLTLSQVQDQLSSLEGTVDCARKEEYDSMLQHFGDLLTQLQADDAARNALDGEKKKAMDEAVAEFDKVRKAYEDSTARLEAAEKNAQSAHDLFVKYKDLVEELTKEKSEISTELSTSAADSKKILEDVPKLRTLIQEMQHAIDTGAEDVYGERMMAASELVDVLPIRAQSKTVLTEGLKSPAKPEDMTHDILATIEEEAKSGAAGLNARLTSVDSSLETANKDYAHYQQDYITFSTDVDLQRDLQREAHAEINQLDGKQMAATLAYKAWQEQFKNASATSASVKSATEVVIAKLADGLAACTSAATSAAADAAPALTLTAPEHAVRTGARAKTRLAKAAQQLYGDPLLNLGKAPADLNDRSVVEGIAAGKYPALGSEAEEKMSPGEVDTFKGAVGEAGTEHAQDKTGENAGFGMPKDAQWVNSWARKLPGAMIIKPVHLTSMDREMLALSGKQ